jgi:hypothetical protein
MKGKTVYYLLGDWLGWLCAAVSLAGLAWAWRLGRARR